MLVQQLKRHSYRQLEDMRLPQVLSTVIAVAATAQAQSSSFAFTTSRRFSSIDDFDIQPTATETASGPIQTGQACAQVAEAISGSRLTYPSVEAEVGGGLIQFWCDTRTLTTSSWHMHASNRSQ